MAARDFKDLLSSKWDESKFLCVGLDPEFAKLPVHLQGLGAAEAIVAFNTAIVDATKAVASSYKPNAAFYEAHGADGIRALFDTIDYILAVSPGTPVILDAKRGDNGNSNLGYIDYAFNYLKADAITVHPYMGKAGLEPFLARNEKGIIVLCKTSNEGTGEFQDIDIQGKPLYIHVAEHVARDWNSNHNCALVVGATYPKEMQQVRAAAGDLPFLIPGIGMQGGDLESAINAGKDSQGRGMIISASRSVIFASSGKDFAEAAEKSAGVLHGAILKAL